MWGKLVLSWTWNSQCSSVHHITFMCMLTFVTCCVGECALAAYMYTTNLVHAPLQHEHNFPQSSQQVSKRQWKSFLCQGSENVCTPSNPLQKNVSIHLVLGFSFSQASPTHRHLFAKSDPFVQALLTHRRFVSISVLQQSDRTSCLLWNGKSIDINKCIHLPKFGGNQTHTFSAMHKHHCKQKWCKRNNDAKMIHSLTGVNVWMKLFTKTGCICFIVKSLKTKHFVRWIDCTSLILHHRDIFPWTTKQHNFNLWSVWMMVNWALALTSAALLFRSLSYGYLLVFAMHHQVPHKQLCDTMHRRIV